MLKLEVFVFYCAPPYTYYTSASPSPDERTYARGRSVRGVHRLVEGGGPKPEAAKEEPKPEAAKEGPEPEAAKEGPEPKPRPKISWWVGERAEGRDKFDQRMRSAGYADTARRQEKSRIRAAAHAAAKRGLS